MSTSSVISELARQVRRDTIAVLDAASPPCLTFAPAGTSNHILWHAGHALWLQDLLCEQLLGAGGHLPAGWSDTFGMNCRPPGETSEWPTADQLRQMLQAQLARILQLLERTSQAKLAEIADASRGPATISDRILHGFHDEAKHCGEMYLLWKLFRVQQTNQ